MKRICCILLAMLSVLIFSGCDSSYEITGLENFSENLCSAGTCDGLLPAGSMFISNRPYEDGDFYYWTDGDYTQAKALVWLQYSEDIYLFKKSICENYYSFSPTHYDYEGFVFSEPNTDESEYNFRGMQMLGYNDDTCTFIFIGYVNYASDKYLTITASNFPEFFKEEISPHLKTD